MHLVNIDLLFFASLSSNWMIVFLKMVLSGLTKSLSHFRKENLIGKCYLKTVFNGVVIKVFIVDWCCIQY